jgi:c-di-GMP-binding flagellar brake protein YcgR
MRVKAEFRRSERFGHESIIKFGDDQTLSPYYALSQNLSETGMHFKSLFELHPGAHILIRIDDYTLNQSQASAKVVWCKKLKNTDRFRYSVGVEFLRLEKNFRSKVSLPIPPRMKTENMNGRGVGNVMEKL